MGKNSIPKRQIGSFDEFCQKTKKTNIKEANEVAINVPFWDDAKEYALKELRQMGGGEPINWETLVKAVKEKFIILDRELKSDYEIVLDHIRDILYQNYFADSWTEGDTGDAFTTANLGTKTLVLSQLASECLHQIRTEAGIEIKPEPETEPKPLATVSLDSYDDFCYEHKHISKQRYRNVSSFEGFTRALNESVAKITCEHDKSALDYVIKKLEKAAGSLNLDDIQALVDDEETTIQKYVDALTFDYVQNKITIELDGDRLKDENGDQKNVLKQARKLFANKIATDVMRKIADENGTKIRS